LDIKVIFKTTQYIQVKKISQGGFYIISKHKN
jgi:hypothetical protein